MPGRATTCRLGKLLEPIEAQRSSPITSRVRVLCRAVWTGCCRQLEPKPGIEPSPTHINSLVPRAKEAGVKLVIIEPYRPRKTAEHVRT